MKNFKILDPDILKDPSQYKVVETGIYQATGDASHRLAMSMELEGEEDGQYPLEDLLDKYFIHVEEFLSTDEARPQYIFGGDLDGLQQMKALVGKRAYYQEFDAGGGDMRLKLVIE